MKTAKELSKIAKENRKILDDCTFDNVMRYTEMYAKDGYGGIRLTDDEYGIIIKFLDILDKNGFTLKNIGSIGYLIWDNSLSKSSRGLNE